MLPSLGLHAPFLRLPGGSTSPGGATAGGPGERTDLGEGGDDLGRVTWKCCIVFALSLPSVAGGAGRRLDLPSPVPSLWLCGARLEVLPEGLLPPGVLGTPHVITVNMESRTWRQVSPAALASCTIVVDLPPIWTPG